MGLPLRIPNRSLLQRVLKIKSPLLIVGETACQTSDWRTLGDVVAHKNPGEERFCGQDRNPAHHEQNGESLQHHQ
jgi:hypothetical protein